MQKQNYFFLFLFFVLISRGLQAQFVTIPDANFLAKLIQLGVDTNGDGKIQQTEAAAVTSLNVSTSSISSLVGIQSFTNLQSLNCYNNQLTALNVNNLVNLQTLTCSSNQLTTLIVSSLVNLQTLACDKNQFTTLDVSALVNLENLSCATNQLTTLDVSTLVNLQKLYCGSNQLTTLDVSALVNLQSLECFNNPLTTLDVSTLVNLQTFVCYSNQLTTLDVSALVNLHWLDCSHNKLTTLDVSALVNLRDLICSVNRFTTLDVTALVNLRQLHCPENKLTTLDVSNLVNLRNLNCWDNRLTTLDVSALVNLEQLFCTRNKLTTLDVSILVNLQYIECSYNQLTTLDLSALVNLQSLYCSVNQFTTLDVSTLVNLEELSCSLNQFTTLDLSSLVNLQKLYCNDNNQLISLNIKNGSKEELLKFSNNPNLQSICIDSDDLALIQSNIAQYGLQNVAVNTLCTYSPGSNYNTLSGTSSYDGDMNGCSLTDSTYRLLSIAITNGIDSGYIYTNLAGQYTTFLDTGTYTLSPQPENSTYFSASPLSTNINFPNNNNNTQIQDFCIVPKGIFSDVEVTISPITVARPGFDATYNIWFHNKGTTVASGNITLDFMGNKMSLVSSSLATSTQTTNQLTWAYSNLQLFESRTITLVMNILPPLTNNIGDTLNFYADISLANANDTLLADKMPDNKFSLHQIVIGSYDPNDKTCLEGNTLDNAQIGKYLHYLVRFQNTGNYPAQNVAIVDSLDASKYDIASLQVLEASHTTHINLKNNVLQFYFENIQLADSFSNEPASHGYVTYKIKTKATLPQNSSVSNKAEIYFDYNPAVVTNTATTTFTNESNASTSTDFQCFPNPAHNLLTIKTGKAIEIEIINVLGETLIRKLVQDKENMDISALASGIYWIKERNTKAGQMFMKD